MSRRHQSSRRRAYGRRQREQRQHELRQRRQGRGQRSEEWLDWQADHHLGHPPAGGPPDSSLSGQGSPGT